MARWEREGIPHKGWKEIGIEDLGEDLESGDDVEYEQCEMCGQEKIRYVHILQHPNFNGELRVGCVCAERMTDDYINPQKTERELKNRLNRKKNFMRREWQERNQGKYVLRYKGENITIIYKDYLLPQEIGIITKGKGDSVQERMKSATIRFEKSCIEDKWKLKL